MNRKKFKRIIAIAAITCMIGTTLFANVALAATPVVQEQATTTRYDQGVINNAIALCDRAAKTNNAADQQAAKNYLATLTGSELVAVYANRMRSYYLTNYLKEGFAYFSVAQYIAMNPDVRDAGNKTGQPLVFAITHYLNNGMVEGRASQTSFDPVVAILADPTCMYDAVIKAAPTPDDVKTAFKAHTGADTTTGYTIVRTSDGKLAKAQPASSGTVASGGGGGGGSSSGGSGSGGSGGGGGGYTPTPSPTPTPTPTPDRTATYLNSKAATTAKTFSPYQFYSDKNSSTNQSIVIGNGVKGTFYGTNYQLYKDTGKQYTLMIYMTASNQEMNESYVRVSAQLLGMMKAGVLDNVNVLIAVGGGGVNSDNVSYYNSYMQKEIAASGLGIYYFNPAGIDTSAQAKLKDIKSEDLIFDTESPKDSSKIISYDNLINEKTMVKLYTTSNAAVDMGKAEVLSGFMNLSSQLYPAQDYGLILSNHGGGFTIGVCDSAKISQGSPVEGTCITNDELEVALASTDIFKKTDGTGSSDGKLGLLFYDACLMGSTEQAYALKDYYRYMLASQEVTMCHTDYYTLLTSINKYAGQGNIDDKALAVELMNKFKETSWHRENINNESTIAVYSSEGMSTMAKNIGEMGSKLADMLDKTTVGDASTLSYKVYAAIRKTLLSCGNYDSNDTMVYSSYKFLEDYVDIGEFATYLKSNLTAVKNNGGLSKSDQDKLDAAITSVDAVLNTGFILANNMYFDTANAYDTKDNQSVISLNDMQKYQSDFWKAYSGANYYGASLYLPFNESQPIGSSTIDWSGYGQYAGSDLAKYISFLRKYLECMSKADTPEINPEVDIRKFATPSEVGVVKIDGIEYVTFKLTPTYEPGEAPTHTLGSPAADMLETANAIELAVVDKDNKLLALSNLSVESIHAGKNEINVDVNGIKGSTKAYYMMSGSGETAVKVYIPISQIEFNESKKGNVISVMGGTVGSSDIISFEGNITADTKTINKYFHIFNKSNKMYICTVVNEDDGSTGLVEAKDITSICCYSFTVDTNGKRIANGYVDNTADTAKYDEEWLFNYQDITKTGVALTLDGLNYTEVASLKDATPKKNTSESPNADNVISIEDKINAAEAGNGESTIEVAETKATEEVTEIKETEKATEESEEMIQETEAVDTTEETEPVETTQAEIIPVSVVPETTVIQTVETTQEAA